MENEEKIPTPDEQAPDQPEEKAPETAEEGQEKTEKEEKKDKKTEKKWRAEIAALTDEKKKAEEALAASEDKYMRLAAEYDNFRRRTQKEKEGIYTTAIADAIEEILPVFDNLELAGKCTDPEKVTEGLAMIYKMTDGMLQKLGVEKFGAPGDTFDAGLHNAVAHVEDDEHGEGEITEVFRQGYRRGDKIIRFAMVKVAN